MRVLVTAASKHGSTAEIAVAIGRELSTRGIDAVVAPIDEVESLAGYDAVILGSAVYAGHWMGAAKDFVERHGNELASRKVWFFSSGPIGDPLAPDEGPVEADELSDEVGAIEHRIFAGRLEKEDLNLAERAVVRFVKAGYGDFRDWTDVRSWARHVAGELVGAAAS